jgi:hypothetical protein
VAENRTLLWNLLQNYLTELHFIRGTVAGVGVNHGGYQALKKWLSYQEHR